MNYYGQAPAYQPVYGQGYGQSAEPAMPMMRQPFQPMQPINPPQMQVSAVQPPDNRAFSESSMIWVQGEAGAKAYMVAPGNSVVLWDSEADVLYIKSADMAGMPCMRVFDYTERSQAMKAAAHPNTQYVTREEFEILRAQISQMMPAQGGTEVNNAK